MIHQINCRVSMGNNPMAVQSTLEELYKAMHGYLLEKYPNGLRPDLMIELTVKETNFYMPIDVEPKPERIYREASRLEAIREMMNDESKL